MTAARVVLGILVAIHWVLPFTPANDHPGQRIIVASLLLGALFLALLLYSRRRPIRAFVLALALLLTVYVVSAVGGASPVREGFVVKLVFASGLLWGILAARRARAGALP